MLYSESVEGGIEKVISQGWIDAQGQLFGVVHRPNDTNSKRVGVILMAGFSLSMCDVDYFMSKLARQLVKQGCLILQVDPYGHGDSEGNLEDVTMETLYQNIQAAIAFIRAQNMDLVFGVGRGISATLMAEFVSSSELDGSMGITPYYLDPKTVKNIWGQMESGIYDCTDIISGRDYRNVTDFEIDKLAFFYALGARMRNLHGQRISTRIFKDLINYEARDALQLSQQNTYWIFYDETGEKELYMRQWNPQAEESYLSLEAYQVNAFPRDPLWQHNAIQRICGWIGKRSKQELRGG